MQIKITFRFSPILVIWASLLMVRFVPLFAQRSEKGKNTDYKLTKTQLIVLTKIVEGKSTEEIAAEMTVTENTVNTHIKAIFRELEVHSRSKAIRKAIEEKIIELKV
jgi:DNA-binding NarL/FixJ family response regulator